MSSRFTNRRRSFGKKSFYNPRSSRELSRVIQAAQLMSKQGLLESEAEYVSQNEFSDFPISENLLRNILNKKYALPTPIQDRAIPAILQGKDIIGIANTGTGKTAAFLIPLVEKILRNKFEKVLIVVPTRELALQINEDFYDLARNLEIKAALCIGGKNKAWQKSELRKQPNVVIGTPGRLKELIVEKSLNLLQFRNVVLDEADRMVDIGFIKDITWFISLLPKQRQSLFFSATISGKVKQILDSFVREPLTISVKQQETRENIKQETIKIQSKEEKIDQLHNLLTQKGFDKVLIFGRTKWGVQKLADQLVRRGFKADAIHGNKRQNQRQKTLERFKRSEIQVLLATDVASRGLDIHDVTHVINYDMPATYEDYIHRIGRTGRAEKKGVALTFVE